MTLDEFQRCLEHGLGRAVVFLQAHVSGPYREMILNACLHPLVYDVQVEGNRARFMFDVISATGELDFYATKTLQTLAVTNDEDSQWQSYDLARLLAANGNPDARQVMYDTFARHMSEDNFTGASTLIELDGMDGLLFVAHHLAQHPLPEDRQWLEETYFDTLEEKLGREQATQMCEEVTRIDPDFAAHWQRIQQMREERKAARLNRTRTPTPDYDKISEMIATGSKLNPAMLNPAIRLQRWGKDLGENTLLRLADDLLREENPERLRKYLRLFQWVRFPLAPDRLLLLAFDTDQATATAARKALSQIISPEARQVALDIMVSSDHP